MDEQTISYYSREAKNISDKYNSVSSGIRQFIPTTFVKGMKILDIGCGSGRDMANLIEDGYDAYGVDASPEMVQYAQKRHPELKGKIEEAMLPNLGKPFGGNFDGILCTAVLMHLPKEELFDAAFDIRGLLKEKGRLLLSIPDNRPDVDENFRDSKGRLFNSVRPEYIKLLFERLGFSIIGQWKSDDTFRPGYTWSTLAFILKYSGTLRPIDQIEGVLTRDSKTATYKLALIRALSEVATTEYKSVRWLKDGKVGIPLAVVAEKWLLYYWPIFESNIFIPQTRGEDINCKKPVAFRACLSELIERYRIKGGLRQFAIDLHSDMIGKKDLELVSLTFRKIGNTIVKGPVTYAGGSLETGRLFGFDNKTKEIIIEAELWTELSLMGYWIKDAVILRWAELTADIARGTVEAGNIIDMLLYVPSRERDVVDVRAVYASLPQIQCAWTGIDIKSKFDVDHIIPFSIWHCNDLWNLLPVMPSVNNKKRDKLPSRSLLLERKDQLVYYWGILRGVYRNRFDAGMNRISGEIVPTNNWQNILFMNVAEAIETVAIQKGCERWYP